MEGHLWQRRSQGLPLRHTIHSCPFCIAIREKRKIHEHCKSNYGRILEGKVRKLRSPFLHSCHAGAVQLVVPLFDEDCYLGTISMGPARQAGSGCPYDSAARKFAELPAYDHTMFSAAQKIMELLADGVVARYRLMRKVASENPTDEEIRQAQFFIMNNLKRGICAGDVAAHVGLSVSRLLHVFKRKCGSTYSEYIDKIRIDIAVQMLLETDYKILHIAFELGLQSESYFCSLFKRHKGLSPNMFRIAHGKTAK